MTTDLADLVVILFHLWKDYSDAPGEYEQLLWRSGELVQPMVQRQRSIAAADRCLGELAQLLDPYLGRRLELPRLIDSVLIYRSFPEGVPPLSFPGLETSTTYPRSRTIDGGALLKSPETTIRQLAARLTLDWLLTLKARRLNQNFGIAYQGERVIEIVAIPESTSLASS